MSSFPQNKLLKSSGLDMVSQPMENKTTSESEVTEEQVLISTLTSKLKQLIKQAVAHVREISSLSSEMPIKEEVPSSNDDDEVLDVDPISYSIPIDYDANIPLNFDKMLRLAVKPIQTRKREKADLIGEISTSFKLSEELLNHAMDLQKANLGDVKEHKFSFTDRLDGWLIKRKRRVNGRFDTYYFHLKSNGYFRSVVEVINFILHEVYPNNLLKKGDHEGSSSSSKSRKRRSPKSNDDSSKGECNKEDMNGLFTLASNSLQGKQIPEKPQGAKKIKRNRGKKIVQKITPSRDSEASVGEEPKVELVFGLLVPEEFQKDLESFSDPPMMAEDIDPSKLEEEMDLINHIPTCNINEFQKMFTNDDMISYN